MALRSETREIGGRSYYCMQLTARKAMLLKARLAKTFGSSLSEIIPAMGQSDDAQAKAALNAIGTLFEANSESDIIDLIVDVVCMANVDKQLMDGNKFDEVFSENLLDAYKVFLFVVEVNFGNLFKGQLANISSQLAKA